MLFDCNSLDSGSKWQPYQIPLVISLSPFNMVISGLQVPVIFGVRSYLEPPSTPAPQELWRVEHFRGLHVWKRVCWHVIPQLYEGSAEEYQKLRGAST